MEPNVPPDDKGAQKKKITFGNIRPLKTEEKRKDKFESLLDFAKENTRDTIAYIVLIIGILLMFFNSTSVYGSLCVGVIFAIYFIQELCALYNNAHTLIEEHGLVKSFVFGGTMLSLFFRAPFLFIGIALVVAIKMLLFPYKEESQ